MMAPLLLMLMMSGVVNAMDPKETIKPGALVAPVGRVLVVEEVLNVRYPLMGLLRLPTVFRDFNRRLEFLHDKISMLEENPDSQNLHQSMGLLKGRIQYILQKVKTSSGTLLSEQSDLFKSAQTGRQKRGLFNFVGLISNKLFGTAQAEDVEALGKRLSVLTQASRENNRLITETYESLNTLNSQAEEAVHHLNQMTTVINTLKVARTKLETLFLYLNI